MSKTQQVQSEMFAAMKNKEADRKESLSLLLSKLKGAQKDKREELTAEEEDAIILKEIKETKESIEKSGGREDIIQKNEKRLQVLNEFAPKFMNEDEIRATVQEVLIELNIEKPSPKDKGTIMKTLMPKVKGKADGKLVNDILGSFMSE